MLILQSIFGFIIILGVLVTLHEFGHFAVAKLMGFPVEVFSIGFGPRIVGFRRKETQYKLCWIPLGGYVKVPGLGLDESDLMGKTDGTPTGRRWQRFLIFMAGSIFNLVSAVVFVSLSFMIGVQISTLFEKPVQIGWVEKGGPADQAGLKPGDTIVAMDGKPIRNWEEFSPAEVLAGGDQVAFTVDRDGRSFTVPVHVGKQGEYRAGTIGIAPPAVPRIEKVIKGLPAEGAGLKPGDIILSIDGQAIHHFVDAQQIIQAKPGQAVHLGIRRGNATLELALTVMDAGGRGRIGIEFAPMSEGYVLRRYALGPAIAKGVSTCLDGATLSYQFLKKLLSGRGSIRQVSGPLDMARISGSVIQTGLANFIQLMGLISLQLAIFNLLPIPLLDGGHLFILLVEAVRRRDLNVELKYRILQAGFVLLASLFFVVLFFDVLKLL